MISEDDFKRALRALSERQLDTVLALVVRELYSRSGAEITVALLAASVESLAKASKQQGKAGR